MNSITIIKRLIYDKSMNLSLSCSELFIASRQNICCNKKKNQDLPQFCINRSIFVWICFVFIIVKAVI